MAPTPNPQVIYAAHPEGYPVPGQTIVYESDKESIDLEDAPLNGGLLVKTLYLSIDPYMRGRMRDPSVPSYAPPFDLHKPIAGSGIGKVVRSDDSSFKAGDIVRGFLPFRAYNILPKAGLNVVENPKNLPVSSFLGVSGGPGLTAYYGLREFVKLKKGDTIFVSTAAGAVGAVVCQLAKLEGLKVIGATGDDEKVDYLKNELGIDVAFNYNKEKADDVLKEHGPINIYWDHVGGETLEAAIEHTAPNANIILCGYASEYNKPKSERYGIKNMVLGLQKSLTFNGFIVTDLIARHGLKPSQEEYAPLVASGKIKYQEHKTIGLEKMPEAFLGMLKGENKGKAIIVVAEE